jgi:hypothetical protein
MRKWCWRRPRPFCSSGLLQFCVPSSPPDSVAAPAARAAWIGAVAPHVSAVGSAGVRCNSRPIRRFRRGHGLRNAVSIVDARPLSGSVGGAGSVLALRRRARIAPGETYASIFAGVGSTGGGAAWRSTVTAAFDLAKSARARPKRAARSRRAGKRLNCFSARQPGAVFRSRLQAPRGSPRISGPPVCGPSNIRRRAHRAGAHRRCEALEIVRHRRVRAR